MNLELSSTISLIHDLLISNCLNYVHLYFDAVVRVLGRQLQLTRLNKGSLC